MGDPKGSPWCGPVTGAQERSFRTSTALSPPSVCGSSGVRGCHRACGFFFFFFLLFSVFCFAVRAGVLAKHPAPCGEGRASWRSAWSRQRPRGRLPVGGALGEQPGQEAPSAAAVGEVACGGGPRLGRGLQRRGCGPGWREQYPLCYQSSDGTDALAGKGKSGMDKLSSKVVSEYK